MRSENAIGPREVELAIFEVLSNGCATYAELSASLTETFSFRPPDGEPGRRRSIPLADESFIPETSGPELTRLSDASLYKTLSLLRKKRLIQSGRYFDRATNKNFTLYANTEDSIEILVRERNYRSDRIRSPYLPGRFAFWHDMDLTKVVRRIKSDSRTYSYQYGFKDDFALRRAAEKATKGASYPDLELSIKNGNGEQYLFRIEVQRSRERVDEFARRLTKRRNNLVLCKGHGLIYDIADTHIFVRDNALFALIDDFIEHGLFETQWLSVDGQIVGLRYSTVNSR